MAFAPDGGGGGCGCDSCATVICADRHISAEVRSEFSKFCTFKTSPVASSFGGKTVSWNCGNWARNTRLAIARFQFFIKLQFTVGIFNASGFAIGSLQLVMYVISIRQRARRGFKLLHRSA